MTNDNTNHFISGLAGLALITLGVKNFKHPVFLTGIAVVAGAYMIYQGVKEYLPEADVEEYLEDPYYAEPSPQYLHQGV